MLRCNLQDEAQCTASEVRDPTTPSGSGKQVSGPSRTEAECSVMRRLVRMMILTFCSSDCHLQVQVARGVTWAF